MATSDIQPWGVSPTPLLPKALVEKLGHLTVPTELKDVPGVHATVAALHGELWDRVGSVTSECLTEIVSMVQGRLPSLKHLAIRSEQPLAIPLQHLPLSTRTRNAVHANLDTFSSPRLTFGEALLVPAFGIRSAIEFACVVEAAVEHASKRDWPRQSPEGSTQNMMPCFTEIRSAFQALSAYAAGEKNLESLAGVMPAAPEDWPPEIKQLWVNLGNVGTRETAGELAQRYSVPALIARGLAPIDLRSRDILTKRVFATESATTLEALGERHSITRERIRQLEKRALRHLEIFRNAEFRPVIRRSMALRERLGIGLPAADSFIESALAWACEDQLSSGAKEIAFVQAFLLWLAGPYKVRRNWLLAEKHLSTLTLDALLARRDERGLISELAVTEVLNHFRFKTPYHLAWIRQLPGSGTG